MYKSSSKIKIAFVKFGGLSAGGTERWLQTMAANLPKNKFEIDYYYCDAAPYIGSDYKHPNTNKERVSYMRKHGINLIKFNVGAKDITKPTHDWVDTNFWKVFNPKKYDIVQTAKAGPPEYPYYILPIPIIEYVTLSAGVDNSPNVELTIHLSEWQRKQWIDNGGRFKKSAVIPIPAEVPCTDVNFRIELGIPANAVVAGFHQRDDDNIFSPIPLQSYSRIMNPQRHFIILGGGEAYRLQAKKLKLSNIHFLPHNGNTGIISKFLNTLDIFAHGRKDGETFGTVFAEAMMHGLPCLSHFSTIANAHEETMNNGGIFALTQDDYQEKLDKLYLDKDLRLRLANNGKNYAEKYYTVQSCSKKLENLYQKVFENLEKEKIKGLKSPAFFKYRTYYVLFLLYKSFPMFLTIHHKARKGVNFIIILLRQSLKIIYKIKHFSIRKIESLNGYFQSSTISYQLHNSEYIEVGALEREAKYSQLCHEQNTANNNEFRLAELIEKNPQLNGQIAVDIGSGCGWLTSWLAKSFLSVHSIEPSASAIEIAREIQHEKSNRIEWHNGFAEKLLPTLELEYPALFTTGRVLSHLPDRQVLKILNAMDAAAKIGSVACLAECWGDNYHRKMWHVRTKDWWQKALGHHWDLEFLENLSETENRYIGIHAVKKN